MDCKATTKRGTPCKMPPVNGDPWCFIHHPDLAVERAVSRRRGGLRSVYGAREAPPPTVASIRSVEDVLGILEEAHGDARRGKPGPDRARALVAIAGVALKALEVGTLSDRIEALERVRALRSA